MPLGLFSLCCKSLSSLVHVYIHLNDKLKEAIQMSFIAMPLGLFTLSCKSLYSLVHLFIPLSRLTITK